MSRDFVVVDLDDLLVQGDRERLAQSKALTQAFFRGTSQRPVEKLSGFRKRAHRVPDVVNRTTEAFVARVAADDLKDHVDEIFQGVRDKLGYKRSDLTPSESGIITPHFEYRVSVGLEPDDPGSSLWTYDVRRITSREVVESDAFDDVFGRYLDSFEQEFATSLDVEQFIDLVEGRDPPGIHLEYDRKCIEVRGEPGRSRWEAGGNVGGSQNHGPAGPVPARPHRGFVFCAPVSHGSTPHARIARRHDALEAAEETTHLARRT